MHKGILIENWQMPHDCTSCPFFKVIVANAGHGSFIRCKVDNRELPKSRIRELMLLRDENCPLKEVQD